MESRNIPSAERLARALREVQQSRVAVEIQPRGFRNVNSTCFMNSLCQALICCPEFSSDVLGRLFKLNQICSPSSSEFPFLANFCALASALVQPDSLEHSVKNTPSTDEKSDGDSDSEEEPPSTTQSTPHSSSCPSSTATSSSTVGSLSSSFTTATSFASTACSTTTSSATTSASTPSATTTASTHCSPSSSSIPSSAPSSCSAATSDVPSAKPSKSALRRLRQKQQAACLPRSSPISSPACSSSKSKGRSVTLSPSSIPLASSSSSEVVANVDSLSSDLSISASSLPPLPVTTTSAIKPSIERNTANSVTTSTITATAATSSIATATSVNKSAAPTSADPPLDRAEPGVLLGPSKAQLRRQRKKYSGEKKSAPFVENKTAKTLVVPFDNILARFQRVPGRQEDVHEFFTSCMVNLHGELAKLGGSAARVQEAEGEWQEMGSKNKKQTLIKPAEEVSTLLSTVLGGRMRLVLSKQTVAAGSVSFQPFFSLHLDISNDNIRTLEQALEAHMSRASVEGYHLGSREVRASMQVQLDTLPGVLVLQLKRFNFHGGTQKLTKQVMFPLDLALPARCLFASQLSRSRSRMFRLRAVVVHHGNNSTDGHYTSYARYDDDRWIHFDDAKVIPVGKAEVASQQAYLLFYENVAS